MPGLRAVLLIASAMTLTVCILPIWCAAFPMEGDYSDTEVVEYTFNGTEVSIEVPSETTFGIHRGFAFMIWPLVTPDDPAVESVASCIMEGAWSSDDRALASLALRWVQRNIDYLSDSESHGTREYWQLPCETLRLGTGDCEDMALLLTSIWMAMGLDAVIVQEPGHVSAAVAVDVRSGDSTVTFGGREYVTADPTGSEALGMNDPQVESTVGPKDVRFLIMLIADVSVISFLAVFIARGGR